MDEANIVDFFQKNGFLVQQEVVEFILKKGIDPVDCLQKILSMKDTPLIISVDLLKDFFIERKEDKKDERKENEEFKIIKEIGEKSNCSGKVNDFLDLFRDRFEKIKEMIKKR
ncbi:MAG: hypothetical protein QXF32_03965, partial [Candidatus Thermoplasmatota archaeon]